MACPRPLTLPERPRILITRLSALGDCIHTLPVACALRRRFPGAYLAWLTQPATAGLLEGHDCLDEVLTVERGWLRSPTAVWALRRRLRGLELDLTVDPQSLTKSAAAAWLSGARHRLGFQGPQGRELSLWLNNRRVACRGTHVVDRYLELLGPLGIHGPPVEFRVPRDGTTAAVTQHLSDVHSPRGFAVLHPGAHWPSKCWPVERYGQLAQYLAARHALGVVITWGSDLEGKWAGEVQRLAAGHARVAPRLTLRDLAALLQAARLFVGSDTGPLHLAAAVGTRCVGLYGPSRPEVCGPYGPGHVALQTYYQAGSVRQRRRASNHALRAITLERVARACDRALRQGAMGPLVGDAA